MGKFEAGERFAKKIPRLSVLMGEGQTRALVRVLILETKEVIRNIRNKITLRDPLGSLRKCPVFCAAFCSTVDLSDLPGMEGLSCEARDFLVPKATRVPWID